VRYLEWLFPICYYSRVRRVPSWRSVIRIVVFSIFVYWLGMAVFDIWEHVAPQSIITIARSPGIEKADSAQEYLSGHWLDALLRAFNGWQETKFTLVFLVVPALLIYPEARRLIAKWSEGKLPCDRKEKPPVWRLALLGAWPSVMAHTIGGAFLILSMDCEGFPSGNNEVGTAFLFFGVIAGAVVFIAGQLVTAKQAASIVLGMSGWGKCYRCYYDLRGLTAPRCPECGEPFDPALLEGLSVGEKKD
jgi:hypothetical protein